MFTTPPTPEEFLEYKKEKELAIKATLAKELKQNNASHVNKIIRAMRRGDDTVTFKGIPVQGVYCYMESELKRLNELFQDTFPEFAINTMKDADSYTVRWRVFQ